MAYTSEDIGFYRTGAWGPHPKRRGERAIPVRLLFHEELGERWWSASRWLAGVSEGAIVLDINFRKGRDFKRSIPPYKVNPHVPLEVLKNINNTHVRPAHFKAKEMRAQGKSRTEIIQYLAEVRVTVQEEIEIALMQLMIRKRRALNSKIIEAKQERAELDERLRPFFEMDNYDTE